MTLETATAPDTATDNSPLTIDQHVALMSKGSKAPPEDEPAGDDETDADDTVEATDESPEDAGEVAEPDEDSEAAAQAADDGEEAPETDTPDTEQEQETEPAQPTLEAPARWDAEAKEVFATLPKKAQEVILAREKLQQAEVTKAQQKSAEVTKALETRIQHLKSLAENIGQNYVDPAQQRMKEWEDWFASEEADELAQTNPAEYLQQQNRHRREKRALDEAIAAKQRAESEAFAEFAKEQGELLPKVAPEFSDPKEGRKLWADTMTWLHKTGVPAEQIKGISAIEAAIALKAKKHDDLAEKYAGSGGIEALVRDAESYRKSMKLAAKAPPPKPKPQAGPRVPATGQAQRTSSSEAELKKLEAKANWSAEDHTRYQLLKAKIRK